MSVTATTINEEICGAAAIMQEIRRDLDAIALRCTELPHPAVTPPTVRRISHASDEVVCPETDEGVEVIGDMLTG